MNRRFRLVLTQEDVVDEKTVLPLPKYPPITVQMEVTEQHWRTLAAYCPSATNVILEQLFDELKEVEKTKWNNQYNQ